MPPAARLPQDHAKEHLPYMKGEELAVKHVYYHNTTANTHASCCPPPQDHAKEHLAYMKGEELASYQGVVAVGGDGLFQEVVSGLLARRARGCAAAYRIRAGHVPAGSTDAVAYT